jgi:thioredoxin 1
MKQIDSTAFDVEVLHSAPPVLVDFYTEQCPPCRIISPLIEEIENERGGSLKVVKIDAAAEPEFTASFRISSVPTLLLFRGGQRIAQLTGARGKKELQRWIDDSLRNGT